MKIKMMLLLVSILLLLAVVIPVGAQHSCGTIASMAVSYDRDAAGFMPRMKEGSQAQFDCIAGRDASFSARRFGSGWEAMNYFLGLLGQELGVTMQLLPAPTN